MTVNSQLFNAPEIDRACPAGKFRRRDSLCPTELGEIRAVLTGDSGNDCGLHRKKPQAIAASLGVERYVLALGLVGARF